MRKPRWVCLLWLAGIAVMCAQTPQSPEQVFGDAILHKDFVLRNFSAETEIHAKWRGSELTAVLPLWHTFGLLHVDSVEFHGKTLEIKCGRHVLMEDENGRLVPFGDKEPVSISVDLNGSEPAIVLPQLQAKLFFTNTSDALSAIPKELQPIVPGSLRRSGGRKFPECDCAARATDACVNRAATAGMKPPQVIRAADPRYTWQASAAHINGVVRLAFALDATGRMTDLWIIQPLGYGLDEQAAIAARQYAFAPAMCHNVPGPVALLLDINFQM